MPKITIFDAETQETIERDMNAEELAQYEADQLAAAEKRAAEIEADAKRKAILDRLGLTEEEAKLLLS